MKRYLWVLAGMLGCAAPLCAEYQKGNHSLQLDFGPGGYSTDYKVNNGDNDLTNDAAFGGMQYLYFISKGPTLGIGPDIVWSEYKEEDPSKILTNTTSKSSVRTAVYQIVGKLTFPSGHFRPYVLGGLGASRAHLNSELTPNAGQTWSDTGTTEARRTFDSVQTLLTGTWGLGMDWFPREHWFLGLEFRQNIRQRRTHQPTAFGLSQGIQPVSEPAGLTAILLKAGYKFGAS